MNKKAELFYDINEPYAAGLFEEPESSKFERYSRAIRRYYENCSLPEYSGGSLYPSGSNINDDYAVLPNYSYTVQVNVAALAKKDESAAEWMNEELKLVSERLIFSPIYGAVHLERRISDGGHIVKVN